MNKRRLRTIATVSGMRALADPSFLGPFRSRRWRRALVLAIPVMWSVTLTGWLAPPGTVPEWLWVGIIPITAATIILLTLATRNLSSSVDAFIDERDRAIRDRAHRLAYWAFCLPFGALLGLSHSFIRRRTVEGVVSLTVGETSVIVAAAVTVVLCYMVLPAAIIGWTEPDPPDDAEDQSLPRSHPRRDRS